MIALNKTPSDSWDQYKNSGISTLITFLILDEIAIFDIIRPFVHITQLQHAKYSVLVDDMKDIFFEVLSGVGKVPSLIIIFWVKYNAIKMLLSAINSLES